MLLCKSRKYPAIYIYSSRTLELLRQLKAFSERGFSVAAFRGKFSLSGKDVVPESDSSNVDKEAQLEKSVPSASEESNAEPLLHANSESSLKASASSDAEEEHATSEPIAGDALCDPEQVPLLAVVGWEGDGGEVASLSSSYLTLWNVSTGSAFLRLKTPALQVMSLQWYDAGGRVSTFCRIACKKTCTQPAPLKARRLHWLFSFACALNWCK